METPDVERAGVVILAAVSRLRISSQTSQHRRRLVLGDAALVSLIDRFLDGEIDVGTFEREFLLTYQKSPIENSELQGPLGRAFLAIEAYDPTVTSETETVHNTTYETMMKELRAARLEIHTIDP